ncbi:uracil-DNA glycosylase-like protein [Choanephora cucurbitarum]|nr:uracil-DNA glycosylase-like protein [Choanephora cucurbitarum]
MSKRPHESEAEKAPKKKQATLFSMFKPVQKAPVMTAPQIVSDNGTEQDTQIDAPEENGQRDPKALFKDVDEETLELLDLEIRTMNYDWLKVLAPELVKPYFLKLKRYLKAELAAKKTIFPPLDQIYSWSNYTPPSKVKVVILGQDPYHNFNQAHGLCFSVIKGVRVPPSLVNMYKALKNDYPDFEIPKHGYLESWAQQGVLMLNTSMSVEAHKAGSHANQGWEQLTDAIIKYLNEKKSNIAFMLWGSHAQKKGARIDNKKHLILKSVHPSPLSAHRGFFECGHFKKANDYLESHGRPTIDWNTLI